MNYEFIDNNYTASTNYYRLKQLDKDGQFTYSNIVVLNGNYAITGGSAIYPNPVANTLNVKLSSTRNNKVTLLLTDDAGRFLQRKVTHLGTGESIIQLNVSHLKTGTYFIKIISADGKERVVKKFLKE